MKIYQDPGYIRVFLLHSLACQLPVELSQAFYRLSFTFRQNNDGTIFLMRQARWGDLWEQVVRHYPRRFPITIEA